MAFVVWVLDFPLSICNSQWSLWRWALEEAK